MDGYGRAGRFLMNAMLASGGYDWLIIPVERRDEYMAVLEKASVEGDRKSTRLNSSHITIAYAVFC